MIAKRHGCGHRIWLEFEWTGFGNSPFYSDDEEESPTVGERILDCPTCGECLSLDVLLTENAYLDSLDDAPPAASVTQLGPQEPPDDPMVYNRRQADGAFRSLAGFWEREDAQPAGEAGKGEG